MFMGSLMCALSSSGHRMAREVIERKCRSECGAYFDGVVSGWVLWWGSAVFARRSYGRIRIRPRSLRDSVDALNPSLMECWPGYPSLRTQGNKSWLLLVYGRIAIRPRVDTNRPLR